MSKESDYFNHQIIKISFLTLFVFVRNVLLFVSRRQNEQGDKLRQRFLFILHLRTHEQSRYISELISEEIRQKATTNTNTAAAHRSSPFLPSSLLSFFSSFVRSQRGRLDHEDSAAASSATVVFLWVSTGHLARRLPP